MSGRDPGPGQDPGPAPERLPVLEPPAVPAEESPGAGVVGVLLAAGRSSRFGDRNKLLATPGEEPLVTRAERTLLAAGLPVVAVVGHESDRVRAALSGDVAVVENPEFAAGQSTSVRTGVRAVADRGADAALIALGDMPAIAPATVRALLATHARTGRSALAAAYRGARGNPVLFDRSQFGALTALQGDTGGRDILLGSDDAALVETGDPGVRLDVDRPEDLSALGDDTAGG